MSTSSPVDVQAFESTGDRVLAVLQNAKMRGETWTSAVALSNELRDDYGIQVHWRTIDATLNPKDGFIARRKRQGRWEYSILTAGTARVEAAPETVAFVEPSNAVQATRKLHDVLSQLAGTVRICDPYLDHGTIEHLEACAKTVSLRLLTMNVKDTGPLRRVIAAAQTAGHQLEIRVVGTRILHDRYIIDDSGMLILGTSLNGFGKKQSFIITAGEDIRATMLSAFDTLWAAASPWP